MNIKIGRRYLILLASACIGLLAAGCYNVQTNFSSCETDAECAAASDGEFDVCGQEGQNFCCVGGAFKCGCDTESNCLEDYTCYFCNDTFCANGQPTICLDESGDAAGLSRVNDVP